MPDALFLACTIMASVLLFGSAEPWAAGLAGAAVTIYFNIRARDPGFFWPATATGDSAPGELQRRGEAWPLVRMFRRISWREGMCICAAGFFVLELLCLAPLPVSVIAFFSKKEYGLIESLPLVPRAWHSLSMDGHEGLEALLWLAVCTMVFIIAERAGRDKGALKRAFSALAFFGFGLVVFAVIQKSTWDGRIYWLRPVRDVGHPFGPFVNRNHFAGFIGMLVPPSLALALEARRPGKTLLYALMGAVMAAGLFYSLSRGGVVSFFASMLVFAFLAAGRPRRRRPGRRAVYYAGLFVFLVCMLFYVLYAGISPLVVRFEQGGLTLGTRLKVWQAALRAVWDFKWLGTGLGTFREIFPLYNPDLQKTFDFAHNDYINLAVETGISGLLLAALFFASFARGVYNYYVRRRPSLFTAGLLSSVAYMLVHSFVDFNLHIPSNSITFAAIAGFSASRIHRSGEGWVKGRGKGDGAKAAEGCGAGEKNWEKASLTYIATSCRGLTTARGTRRRRSRCSG